MCREMLLYIDDIVDTCIIHVYEMEVSSIECICCIHGELNDVLLTLMFLLIDFLNWVMEYTNGVYHGS